MPRDEFARPPASVADACELFLQGTNLVWGDPAANTLVQAIVFASFATAGRLLAAMQPSLDPCNAAQELLRVRAEAERVVIEAAHLASIGQVKPKTH